MPDNKINGAQSMNALSWQNHWKFVTFLTLSKLWRQSFEAILQNKHIDFFLHLPSVKEMQNKVEAEVAKTADYGCRYGTK